MILKTKINELTYGYRYAIIYTGEERERYRKERYRKAGDTFMERVPGLTKNKKAKINISIHVLCVLGTTQKYTILNLRKQDEEDRKQ